MGDALTSSGAPLIPPAYDLSRVSDGSDDPDVVHDLPFLLPLSHSHPLLSPTLNPSWDVDSFLLSRLHTPLDELRTDLRSYLGVLKEELVQLINEDYTEFISLGTGLRGEGKRLDRVKGPVGELRRDVEVIRSSLVSNEQAVEDKLAERATLRDEKTLLQLLLSLTDSLTRTETLLDIPPASSSAASSSKTPTAAVSTSFGSSGEGGGEKLVARVAAEYTRVLYLAEKARADGCAIVGEVEWRIERIRNTLNRDLDHLFSETLASLTGGPSTSPHQDKVRETLLECLKTYQLVEGWRDAEDLFRRELVRPFVRKIISADVLLSGPMSPSIPQTPYLSLSAPSFSNPLSPGAPPTPGSAFPMTPSTPSNPFDALATPTQAHPHPPPSSSTQINDDSALAQVYNRLLREVEQEAKVVLDVAEKLRHRQKGHRAPTQTGDPTLAVFGEARDDEAGQPGEEGFDFFGNVIWKEIGDRLMDELGSVIFAAGRPAELHQHYTFTHLFFTHLESLAPSLSSVLAMRAHPTYTTFEKRWQLPVYFQLRWKEIVTSLEEAMASAEREKERGNVSASVAGGKDSFALPQTKAVFSAIESCWAPGTFIPELAHRFWRLNLQILSRYRTFLSTTLPTTNPTTNPSHVLSPSSSTPATSGRSTPLPSSSSDPSSSSQNTNNTTDPAFLASEDAKLLLATQLVSDVSLLSRRMSSLWEREVSSWVDFSSSSSSSEGAEDAGDAPERILLDSLSGMRDLILPPLSNQIVAILTRRCGESFQLVRSVASSYRNTTSGGAGAGGKGGAGAGAGEPKEASYFVKGILKPVRVYFGKGGVGERVDGEVKEEWRERVWDGVAGAYAATLLSVSRSDASLRKIRLAAKARKSTPFSLFSSSSSSAPNAAAAEEEKRNEANIRKQIILDVEGLRKEAEEMGVVVEGGEAWRELRAVAAGEGVEGTS